MTTAQARAAVLELPRESMRSPHREPPCEAVRPLRVELPRVAVVGRSTAWEHGAPQRLAGLSAPLAHTARAHVVAGLVALLHRYTEQRELVLDVFVRDDEGERAAPLAFAVEPDTSFATLRAHAVVELRAPSAQTRSNVALTFTHVVSTSHSLAPLTGDHELCFVVHEEQGRAVLRVAYDGAVYERALVEHLLESFLCLLEASLLDADVTLAALPLLSNTQVAAILRASEGDKHERHDEPVHQRFERLAQERPDALAVRCGDRSLSYRELDERAAQLAHYLAAAGVQAETMVAVCLTPSIDVLVALLAIFKAGGVYVPLDPSHPTALLALILEEARPVLVLTCRAAEKALPGDVRRFCFEDDWAIVEHLSPLWPVSHVRIDQACYVLYTSGTTGRPKGVVASHQNLAHYLGAARDRYGFHSDDVFCSLARYTFSISFFELLSPLTSGGSLVLLTRDEVLDPACLAKQLEQVSVLHAGPSLLASLFRHLRKGSSADLTHIRHASTGGDLVPPALLEEMKQVFARAEIFVIYGCTEISCMGCTAEVSRVDTLARTSVGRPFENVALRVLDTRGALAPFGVVGEVYFAGEGLARRYLQRPELTSERFVAIDGQRFYRTGDLGRLAPDGQLELLGRSDFQVQLRGIRVELGGIEHTIRELGLAEQCAVIAAERAERDLCLVAFVVQPSSAHDGPAMRALLAQHLPDYMLPQSFVVLTALPLTHNGKLDRRALQQLALAPQPSSVAQTVQSEPVGSTERLVAQAFEKILKLPSLGREADFFLLGGHSLMAVLLAEELTDQLGRKVSPALLFEHTSVCALASALASADDHAAVPILLSQSDKKPALFMLLGVHLYGELARALEDHYAVYGVYASGELSLLDAAESACSVVELAREYIALIRAQQPCGPYRIGGMSFGGVVAYEVAQQLEQAGQEVELLLLLDAVLPQTRLQRARRLFTTPVSELVDRLGKRARRDGRALAALGMMHHDSSLQSLEDLRQQAYRAAASKYSPAAKPYAGELTLVVAGERLACDPLLEPACGFARLSENLTVHTLPVAHLALLEQPAVCEVARFVLAAARPAGRRRCIVPLRTSVLTSA